MALERKQSWIIQKTSIRAQESGPSCSKAEQIRFISITAVYVSFLLFCGHFNKTFASCRRHLQQPKEQLSLDLEAHCCRLAFYFKTSIFPRLAREVWCATETPGLWLESMGNDSFPYFLPCRPLREQEKAEAHCVVVTDRFPVVPLNGCFGAVRSQIVGSMGRILKGSNLGNCSKRSVFISGFECLCCCVFSHFIPKRKIFPEFWSVESLEDVLLLRELDLFGSFQKIFKLGAGSCSFSYAEYRHHIEIYPWRVSTSNAS